jgi:hypothetical protein
LNHKLVVCLIKRTRMGIELNQSFFSRGEQAIKFVWLKVSITLNFSVELP